MIVVDASVAVKWFLPEPGSDQAMSLLAGSDALIAPEIIRAEVVAAFTRRVRMKEISAADAKESTRLWLEALKDGVLQIGSTLEDLREAADFSLQLNHTLYDCHYLALARRTSSRFITADEKFARKAVTVYPGAEYLAQ